MSTFLQGQTLTASKTQQYSDLAMKHALTPQNVGKLDEESVAVGTGVVGNPQCGDVMKLQLKIENGKITEAKFKTFGCGAAVASSSYATELVTGKTLAEAKQLSNLDISKKLSLPPVKLHCSLLAEEAIKAAIVDFEKKQGNH
ncbi:Iron-sulfur_cluster biosynthesis protein IscU [Hexamita inflata]|uniref:Iron-sulfur cluster biosynthesis protein IscU n=1 Tax=Hexamita inflata TaxID=28002 RepID=A0AA86NNQ3_9EUKA|nr:Iron-sulfur cluster biosynthesis protein IscU [Hexamita inflata]CAI9915346.1 Iron-sulfur cluster biosynthesis protein IscU [Hexamita inflata]CAI9915349.1 Iron-sulfur cluster biosynthesis protein IscU [Hexamita inflata]CAI9923731.1 Iron-sulfur cluster biosynthesis protein IscU [Hexamita inflata]CAI9923735.1 Iron-sulfur cluster biosynthesis protein IscU [Hexamita inflata]